MSVRIWHPKVWILPQTPTLLNLLEGKQHVLAGGRSFLCWNLYRPDHIPSSQRVWGSGSFASPHCDQNSFCHPAIFPELADE